MPNSTFYNLEEEKKQRIINAARKEFKQHLLHKSRISNIIADADIPRGSFYQYFDDIEDLYFYIIDLAFEELFDQGREIAKQTDDLFDFFEKTFEIDYKGYFVTKDHLMLMNLMQNARQNKSYLEKRHDEHQHYIRDILNHMDLSKYRKMTMNEYAKVYELLQNIKRHILHVSSHDDLSLKEAMVELKWQLKIIKRGIAR
jgi:AcrR family transcriptional regulator